MLVVGDEVHFAEILPVHDDRSGFRSEISGYELHERRFSRSGVSHECCFPSSCDLQVEPLEQAIFEISESEIRDPDVSVFEFEDLRVLQSGDLRNSVEGIQELPDSDGIDRESPHHSADSPDIIVDDLQESVHEHEEAERVGSPDHSDSYDEEDSSSHRRRKERHNRLVARIVDLFLRPDAHDGIAQLFEP